MLEISSGAGSHVAWSSPLSSPNKISLDLSVLNRPPPISSTTVSSSIRKNSLSKSHPRQKRSKTVSRKVWRDSIYGRGQETTNGPNQMFLYCSQPRLVSTAGPTSPANSSQIPPSPDDSEVELIPLDWWQEPGDTGHPPPPPPPLPADQPGGAGRPPPEQHSPSRNLKRRRRETKRRGRLDAWSTSSKFADYVPNLCSADDSPSELIVFPGVLYENYDFSLEYQILKSKAG